jgi:hypothetical protein
MCSGTTHTYSISSVSGATGYTWSVPGGATINSGQGTTNLNITYGTNSGSVSVTADNACGSSTAETLSITVDVVPAQPGTISGNATLCSGTTHTYSISAVSGATGYTWSVPSGATINSGQGTTSINVTFGTNSGSISVTANNACGNSTARTKSVTVNAYPNNGITQSDITLTAIETGATYRWLDCNNDNAPISGATAQSYTATENGSYAVEVTKNGCKATSTCTNISTVGIEAHAQTVFNIYPNPASNEITIELYQQGEYTLKIIDVTGKVVADFGKVYQDNKSFNISNLSDGLYFVRLETQGGLAIKKIVKQ